MGARGQLVAARGLRTDPALLALPQPPDGIFCCSDYMAQGCYQAIIEAGLRIPEDILVAGHDNQMLASEMEPLSSIGTALRRDGQTGGGYLAATGARREADRFAEMKLRARLIRASTRPAS